MLCIEGPDGVKDTGQLLMIFFPGDASTPLLMSKASGVTVFKASATFSALSPPDKISGILPLRPAAKSQLDFLPVPP